jgi:hypothetical protein
MFRKCLAKKGNERFSFIVLNNTVQHSYPAHSLLSFRSPERTGQHQTSEKLSAAMNHWCKLLVGAGQASPSSPSRGTYHYLCKFWLWLPDSFILKFPVASGHAGLCGELPARSVSRSTTPDWTAPRFSDLISSTTLLRTTGQISHISPQSVAAQPVRHLFIATLLLIAARTPNKKGNVNV